MFERNTQGTINIVRGDDALVSESLDQLSDLLKECLDQGQPRAVLDMQDAAMIDSAGLELLLDTQTDFQRRGGVLKLATVNPLCEEILSVSGVASHFEIHSDVRTAVGSFAQ